MAGLDRGKKRSGSGNPRVSRFSEVLGAAHDSAQKPGYPESQQPSQPATQSSESTPALENVPQPGYPETQPSKQSVTQPSQVLESSPQLGYPETQPSKQSKEKLAKRENPDYTQTTFRIPKKLSRQINRALMDLADEGVEIDRSDLLEELAGAFIRKADEVGVVEALEQFKNLGTQMDE
ncbi:hypothetical protein F7734_39085 [Scytonema sp. UIC 10036]|uniref:hypothetical protein n=1 Tax=Scytonema sp. UIC 10036 TaxID=2304196 RepID=UPI0012DA6DD6|nr:hypothetical protein [Scytonema sp. UIC 10036]MUG97972.1 hypothetical protein [Scytonema sp. UIC 10036]MUG97997.1 hypothetical protein [Scytonema sp. UIC 10036]